MIVPDIKDWTWVVERTCPECSFDGRACAPEGVADLVRHNAREWRRLLADGNVVAGRPDDATWSSLEYACHVRDVYRRYRQRIELMRTEADPLYANWDQDASAIDDRYETQEPTTVVDELAAAAAAVAAELDEVTGDEWSRPGRRSDGATFTIDTISRYMVHDTIHHVWDVERD